VYFEQIRCGGDRNFGYLLADLDAGKCAVIDPSPDPDALLKTVKERGLEIVYIINTHTHYDHTGGNLRVKAVSKARLHDFEEFYYLKEHWAEYKRKHNIE